MDITGPVVSCRMSVGSLEGADATHFKVDARDRRAEDYYTGHYIHCAGQQRLITYFGNNRWGNVAPWDTIPALGTPYEIFAAEPDRWGRRWRIIVDGWWSALGNGGGGALKFQYDRSVAGDWSDPVTMMEMAPKGTPGQNGNDAELTFNSQVVRFISENTLRGHPRWQDGNLLVPPDAHTGTDETPHDLGPEFTMFRRGDIPRPNSRIGTATAGALNSNGVDALYGQTAWRVRTAAGGAEQGEFLVCPANSDIFWVFTRDGFYREDQYGNLTKIA